MLHGGLGMQGTKCDELIKGGNIMTGVLGLGSILPLGVNTWLRTDLDLHAYTTFFEIGDAQTDELTQYDMVLAVGIQFRTGGK